MFKYFEERNRCQCNRYVSIEEIEIFRIRCIAKIISLGANENDIKLITDEVIKTSILNKHNPYDLAWAIMQ